jgi:hypothetical protein
MTHFFLSGGIFVVCLFIALIFGRMYRKTRDRLFVFFAIAFCILAVERLLLVQFGSTTSEYAPYVYLVRLLAYLAIITAIVDKNRRG